MKDRDILRVASLLDRVRFRSIANIIVYILCACCALYNITTNLFRNRNYLVCVLILLVLFLITQIARAFGRASIRDLYMSMFFAVHPEADKDIVFINLADDEVKRTITMEFNEALHNENEKNRQK